MILLSLSRLTRIRAIFTEFESKPVRRQSGGHFSVRMPFPFTPTYFDKHGHVIS
jgi:hypothetical protein